MNKTLLRKQLLEKRKNFDLEYKNTSNLIITNKVIDFIKQHQFKQICIFLSTKYEIETRNIINWCLNHHVLVFVPKITTDNNMNMVLLDNSYLTNFNKFNIQEPTINILANLKEIDCVFTPVVGFDKKLNRIGMGKGFYDKFFSLNSFNYLKVGLCFDKQKVDQIFIESNDIKLDYIITENKNIYKLN
ncbi:5-formyltetrahydrofolate cyclo-ligase [Mycoplasma mycoides subsp. mycoides]|uniref:5-formyltetrahydrofolate cyclo-ligase n=2 Tax=Mycoplasma mycoides subsp. mycoides TaxID=2103 RepID=Q6MTA5_MYCMS|nr:5-formyltetrahydrofolate cyclo-ligase [Mycoplasma mycoides]CAE77131.1 5-formyltetrahydrofolate cyclo-ligase [Mycoplasma mycoides subsp. mycoides SC str. PG1]ADK69923.1 5-formyltetrahydrofolate cyclo-ligase [Mycoplasma mycoides subsp. mycoides SC str. Gladysdale]AIZ55364.1 5-formyltetrahydrofolate cyclo-ligase [Mycoplasma mycoides subsp. mycoides]AME10711.1 5-formyltetrahydrofolate cyclo-ligase [Mycoplasma mycoides subsp. mycoides]AME11721.1 5-formyltetrahydrofolate cyclo-ligase [Mycoplasma 